MPVPDGLPTRTPPNHAKRERTLFKAQTGLALGRSASLAPLPQGGGGVGRLITSGTFAVVIHGDDGTVERPIVDLVYWVGAATPDNGEDYDFWYTEDVT